MVREKLASQKLSSASCIWASSRGTNFSFEFWTLSAYSFYIFSSLQYSLISFSSQSPGSYFNPGFSSLLSEHLRCERSGSQPVGHYPPTGVPWDHRKTQIFALQFITVAKLQLWSSNKSNFMVGVTTTWGTVLEGHSIRKGENHCSRIKFTLNKYWSNF